MTTYRIISAPSSLTVRTFDSYNEALEFNRANGLQARPIRRIANGRIQWSVTLVGKPSRPEVVKLPHWERPKWHDAPSDFAPFKPVRQAPVEPQPECYLSQWDEANQPKPQRRQWR